MVSILLYLFNIEISDIYELLHHSVMSHSSTLAPQDNPAPNPARTSFCPFFRTPSRFSSFSIIGMLADEVFHELVSIELFGPDQHVDFRIVAHP